MTVADDPSHFPDPEDLGRQHGAARSPHDTPFDHRASDEQTLTFSYTRKRMAERHADWDDDTVAALRLALPDGTFTNTGLLLSDQCPFVIKCARFDGDSKATLLEHRELTGPAPAQIDAALTLIKQQDSLQDWPARAVRESLVNAVLHRDYEYSGPTLINLFSTRIEIVSLGGLVQDLEVNDLLNGISQARNTWLATAFNRLGLSENYGTGMQRIMEAYADGVVSPQLRVGPRSIAMVLPQMVPGGTLRTRHEREDAATEDPTTNPATDSDAGRERHAKLYAFPNRLPPTDNPAIPLSGMRVIGAKPLPTLLLGARPTAQPTRSKASQARQPWTREFTYTVETLEEVTLHLLAQRGTPLSRAQIQHSLGLNKNQAAHLLHTLARQGKINVQGRSRATRYVLP